MADGCRLTACFARGRAPGWEVTLAGVQGKPVGSRHLGRDDRPANSKVRPTDETLVHQLAGDGFGGAARDGEAQTFGDIAATAGAPPDERIDSPHLTAEV